MKRLRFLILIVVMVAGGTLPAIAHQPATTSMSAAEVDDLVGANNQFAFDLYAALSAGEDNLIFSPYGISMALAMVYAGADGNTATQIAETLHFDMVQDTLDSDFFDLQTALNSEVEAPEGIQPSELSIVNGLWNHNGFPFRQAYMDLLQTMYQAGATPVDFERDAEGARERINGWINENTNERIENMLAPGSISTDTRLILVNAIFFKGTWLKGFDESYTVEGSFMLLDGATVTVPMMSQEDEAYEYFRGENYQLLSMVLQDNLVEDSPRDIAMFFILPDQGTFNDVEAVLDAAWFDGTLANLDDQIITVTIPRFSYETDLDLKSMMQQLGMTDAFSPELANFSGITTEDSNESLFISMLLHRANIDVDEAGIEASAASVPLQFTALLEFKKSIMFNRPFIYAIYDRVSGLILFMGRVLNPQS